MAYLSIDRDLPNASRQRWIKLEWVLSFAIVLSLPSWAQAQPEPALERYELVVPSMGTTVEMVVYATSEAQARQVMDAGWKEIDRLAKIVSNYDEESEISKLCSEGYRHEISISSDLNKLFQESNRWRIESDGAFDIAVGPLTRLWRQARKSKQLPSPEEIRYAQERCRWDDVRWVDKDDSATAELNREGMWLDLSGIATGYILDRAFEHMVLAGSDRILINAGGDIRVGKAPPDTEGWSIQIAGLGKKSPPLARVQLHDCAITSSGDLFQFVEIDGHRYSHFVDPATGAPVERRQCVTAIAPTAIDADAGATAIAILGADKASEIFEQMPLTTVFIVQSDLEERSPVRYRRIDREQKSVER